VRHVVSIYEFLVFRNWQVVGVQNEQNRSEYRTLREVVALRSPCAGAVTHVDSEASIV